MGRVHLSKIRKRTKAAKSQQKTMAKKCVSLILNEIIDNIDNKNVKNISNASSHIENVNACVNVDVGYASTSLVDVDHNYSLNALDDIYESINSHQLYIEKDAEEESTPSGFRIVDIGHLLNKTISLQSNHNKKCTGGKLIYTDEKRTGLLSRFFYTCNICENVVSFTNSKDEEINTAAVWGTLSTGSTFSHLEELLSVLDIPSMTRNTFFKIQRNLGKKWKNSLWETMEAAGKEEATLAIERGDIDADGIPFITVYLDGCWSKRSYGHNYNASSGLAVIIGKCTGKLLFIGVKNKYCLICARAEGKNVEPGTHVCFKNWSKSSAAMEAEIIVEGFCKSIDMHNLKYATFIADGDSTVFSRIRECVPYGMEVAKVECTNHLLKNYSKQLYKIKSNTKGVSLEIRKLLVKSRIDNLVMAAKKAIYINEHGDVEILKNDVRNSINHVFGNYLDCKASLCKTIGQLDNSLFSLLQSTGAQHFVFAAINNIILKAGLVIDNETNNRSELFMSLVARFNMGKRLNLVQRDSFQSRACLAGLRYNHGINWHTHAWKHQFKNNIGKYMSSFIEKRTNLLLNRKRYLRKRKRPLDTTGGKSYGPNISDVFVDEATLKEEVDALINRLQVTSEQQKAIENNTVGQFNNTNYIRERQFRLTASNFGQVMKRRESTPCDSLVKSILNDMPFESAATRYGKMYEDVAIKKFSELYNKSVQQSGLFVDVHDGVLGASPDGIISEEEIVEVKCLYKVATLGLDLETAVTQRIVPCLEISNGQIILKKNHNYYYQIQGQLGISKRNTCYFIVYSGVNNDLFVEAINRDDHLYEEVMKPKLISFYKGCIGPEIILQRRFKNLKCKDPT